jgi:hypothetical protein
LELPNAHCTLSTGRILLAALQRRQLAFNAGRECDVIFGITRVILTQPGAMHLPIGSRLTAGFCCSTFFVLFFLI